jgi:hypothetical protein
MVCNIIVVASFKFPEKEEAIICDVRSLPTCCVKELIVLPWKLLKNPVLDDRVLVTKVDVNNIFAVIVPTDILLVNTVYVLSANLVEVSPAANAVDKDEIPSAKIE